MEIYHYLMSHPSRTLDPCQADVFFMPLFAHKMVEVLPPHASHCSLPSGLFSLQYK